MRRDESIVRRTGVHAEFPLTRFSTGMIKVMASTTTSRDVPESSSMQRGPSGSGGAEKTNGETDERWEKWKEESDEGEGGRSETKNTAKQSVAMANEEDERRAAAGAVDEPRGRECHDDGTALYVQHVRIHSAAESGARRGAAHEPTNAAMRRRQRFN